VKRVELYVLLVEATSIPLLVTSILLIISGYVLAYPYRAHTLSLGLMDYRGGVILHTLPLIRIVFVFTLYLHGVGGVGLLATRYVKNRVVREVIEISTAALLTVLLLIPLAIDVAYQFHS